MTTSMSLAQKRLCISSYRRVNMLTRCNSSRSFGFSLRQVCSQTHKESFDDESSQHTDSSSAETTPLQMESSFQGSHFCKNLSIENQSQNNGLKEAVYLKRCGQVMRSMLHIMYWEMKDRHLVDNSADLLIEKDTKSEGISTSTSEHLHEINVQSAFYSSKQKSHWKRIDKKSDSMVHEEENSHKRRDKSAKELFFQKMFLKYQDPSAKDARFLAQCFPDPQHLLSDVISPLVEASGQSLPELVLTNHLRQTYWKAGLPLLWSQCVTATHPHREQAIHNVMLKACDQLERLGLIWYDSVGKWQPMKSDKVVLMLETLAKYVESSYIASKGRGFKIILSQAKNTGDLSDKQSPTSEQERGQRLKMEETFSQKQSLDLATSKLHASFFENITDLNSNEPKDNLLMSLSAFDKCADQQQALCHIHSPRESCLKDFLKPFSNSNVTTDASLTSRISSIPLRESVTFDGTAITEHSPSHLGTAIPRTRWACTVHVGWPFPFTVVAHGVSLPAAQMLGYMKAVSKLKAFGLLTSCNSTVSPAVLGRLMRIDLQSHWEWSLLSSWDQATLHKFSADAELFCDASIAGFGAYLVKNGIPKVSWLCEKWEDHDKTFLELIYPRRWVFSSTLGELYACVTSVYSWKKKLRGKRLLCFSDNQTTAALINSHRDKQIQPERCLSPVDRLLAVLQTTCANYNIIVHAAWLDRNSNSLADLLSRRDTERFQKAVPEAAYKKTKTKRLSIPWARYKNKKDLL